MYFSSIKQGINPEQFWTYTLAELFCVLSRSSNSDQLLWNHTSSLMSLLANINSAKGKTYKPIDFNPYDVMSKKDEFKTKQEVLDFVKSIKPLNG